MPPISSTSLQKASPSLGQNLVIIPLKSQPALLTRPDLTIRKPGLLIPNNLPLMSAPTLGRVDEQLCMTCLIEAEEPECGLVDAGADGEETVVLENAGFVRGAEGGGDGLAFGSIEPKV